MSFFNLAGYNFRAKIIWYAMFCLSLLTLGVALYECRAYNFSQFAILGAALLVAVFASQHKFRVPRTKLKLSARKIFVFWGAIWLGVPGAVLLAACASLAKYQSAPKDKRRWLYSVFINIFAAFAASEVFYLVLREIDGFDAPVVAGSEISIGSLLIAAAAMALAHHFLMGAFELIFLKFEDQYQIGKIYRDNYLWTVVSYAAAVAATFAVYFCFVRYGVTFGLFILPVVLGGHLAYRFYLSKLDQKVHEIREASRIHLATVETLATAIDARDQVGVGHVRRTQIYAVGIGELLGLSEEEIAALRTGALLHDIGKLAVPDHILNKPGRLTPAEMEKMKIHSSVGAAILEKVGFNYPVVPTVRHHHEAWDGSGYPDGLAKEKIPLTARIIAIADSYDTLRSARPYRSAISREEARRHLINGAGAQFDPKLVDIFLRNLRLFEKDVEAQELAYNFQEEMEDLFETDDQSRGYVGQIQRANREVFALYELARVFSSSLSLSDTLSLFAKKVEDFVPFDTCVVYLYDEKTDSATAAHAAGANCLYLKNKKVKSGEGATGYALAKRQAVYNINPALDLSFYKEDFIQDYTAMASLPLLAEEKLVGAISLYSCDLDTYEDEHMRLLETISRIAADAINKTLQHEESESRAMTDPMTNLPNARSLQTHFEKEAARARRSGTEFQVIMCDLDGFKAVNDTFGHKAGDALLREIGKVMRGQLRDYDFLARYAGDEFVALVPEMCETDIRELSGRIEKAVLGFGLPVSEGRTARVGISIGTACYPQAGETIDQLIIAADKDMYAVKAAHKEKAAKAIAPLVAARETAPATRENSPAPIQVRLIPPAKLVAAAPPIPLMSNDIVVELDENNIISNAIN